MIGSCALHYIIAAMKASRESALGSGFQAGEWIVWPEVHRITSGDTERRLRPLQMDLLVSLAEHAGHVLSKDEILNAVWKAEFVSDSSLTREIAELRQCLGDDRSKPKYIETIPKQGYRFIAPVRPGKRAREPRLAVLLFNNLNRDPELEYFAEGISDVLITELGNISGLRVISRQSMLYYKNSIKSLPEIAKELKVDAIVEGSTLHVGNRIRINAQLVRTDPEEHLWARDYDCEMGDVLAIQARVARAVAESINAAMTPQDIDRLSRQIHGDAEVHRTFLKAYFHTMRWTREDFELGLRYLNEVIEKDPTFAPAYELLSSTLLSYAFWGHTPQRSAIPQAVAAAAKSVQLDDSLAEGHATLGITTLATDPAAAEREMMRAIQLNPSSPYVRLSYALFLQRIRRDARGSIEQAMMALEMDPLSEHTNFSCAWVLFFGGEYQKAAAQALRTIEMYRDSLQAYFVLGWAKLALSKAIEAVAAFEKAVELSRDAIGLGYLGQAYGFAGRRDEAQAVLNEILEKWPSELIQTSLAYIYLGLSDFDQAFQALEKCLEQRDTRIAWFPATVFSENFRADPRFALLSHRLQTLT
jgi:TolB-like protein